MIISPRSAPSPLNRSAHVGSMLLLVGGVCGLAGCQAWTSPDPASRGAVSSSESGGSEVRVNAGMHSQQSGDASARNTQAPVVQRRPGKLDPFWIQTTAEADRAIWAVNDPLSAAATGVPGGSLPNPKAISTGPLVQPLSGGTMMADGADGLNQVTFAAEGADFDPCISREGTFMVFASTQHRPTADIYAKGINGRTITQLTSDPGHDIMPALSPDSRRIAFCSNRNGNWDIFIMAASGGQAIQITGEASHELHPTWSPDGSKLAYCKLGQSSGRWELWVLDMQSTGTSEFIGYGLFPQWCPKSATAGMGRDKILFQRARERGGRAFSVWTLDYKPGDVSSPTEIMASPGAAFINACWSPDGSRIVYASVDLAAQQSAVPAGSPNVSTDPRGAASELWMCNIDGTGRVNLTNSGAFMNLMPCWGADNRIYFVSDRSGLPNIWSLGTEKAIQAAVGSPSPLQGSAPVYASQGMTSFPAAQPSTMRATMQPAILTMPSMPSMPATSAAPSTPTQEMTNAPTEPAPAPTEP